MFSFSEESALKDDDTAGGCQLKKCPWALGDGRAEIDPPWCESLFGIVLAETWDAYAFPEITEGESFVKG